MRLRQILGIPIHGKVKSDMMDVEVTNIGIKNYKKIYMPHTFTIPLLLVGSDLLKFGKCHSKEDKEKYGRR
jgi:hypothetical protein